MPILTEGVNAVDAWLNGINLINKHNRDVYNLITTVQDPTHLDENWIKKYNPNLY